MLNKTILIFFQPSDNICICLSAPAKINSKRVDKGLEAKFTLQCGFCDKRVALKKLAKKLKRQLKKSRRNNRNKGRMHQNNKKRRNKNKSRKNKPDSMTTTTVMPVNKPDITLFEKLPEYDTTLNEVEHDMHISQLIDVVESIPSHEVNDVDNEVFETVFEPEYEEGEVDQV